MGSRSNSTNKQGAGQGARRSVAPKRAPEMAAIETSQVDLGTQKRPTISEARRANKREMEGTKALSNMAAAATAGVVGASAGGGVKAAGKFLAEQAQDRLDKGETTKPLKDIGKETKKAFKSIGARTKGIVSKMKYRGRDTDEAADSMS